MLLRVLREPLQGRPSLLARLIALLLVLGLVATVSPALIRGARWMVLEVAETVF